MKPLPSTLITLLMFATAGCGGGPEPVVEPVDPNEQRMTQYLDAAFTAYQAHEYKQAARLYGNALDKARSADDSGAIADAAYNRAACYALLEQWEEADDDLSEALLRAPTGDATADVLLLKASVLRRLNQPDQAATAIERALSESTEQSRDRHRFAADVLRGHLACDRNDVADAERYASSAESSSAASPLSTTALRARIAELRKSPEDAGPLYDREAELARDAGRYRQMARALGDAGRCYGEVGGWALAGDRHYRSARAYLSQDDVASATAQAGAAAQAASRVDIPDLSAAIAKIHNELSRSGPTTQSPRPTSR